MKTFTKIVLAAGIIGAIGKIVNDHLVISVKKKEPEEKKSEPEIKILYDAALDGTMDFDDPTEPDHIYYDNKYNACKIYKDENSCPWYFEFVHPGDAECALYRIADGLLDRPNGFGRGAKISLKDVFDAWGLVIDDYQQFADWSVCWEYDEFIEANYENADPKIVSFGEFESPKEEAEHDFIYEYYCTQKNMHEISYSTPLTIHSVYVDSFNCPVALRFYNKDACEKAIKAISDFLKRYQSKLIKIENILNFLSINDLSPIKHGNSNIYYLNDFEQFLDIQKKRTKDFDVLYFGDFESF